MFGWKPSLSSLNLAQEQANRVFKTRSLDLTYGFFLPLPPPDDPEVVLLRLNLVLIIQPDLIYCTCGETEYQYGKPFSRVYFISMLEKKKPENKINCSVPFIFFSDLKSEI